MTFECRTQEELDAAVKKAKPSDLIACYGGTWDKPLVVRDSSRVTAYDSSQVTAYGSSQVTAYGSSQVTACDSSQVTAYGSSQVTAYDSSQVTAYGSSQVTASGSAQVRACDSSQVTACDSSQVTASKYVAVTKLWGSPKISGGVLIEVPQQFPNAEDWLDYHGLVAKRGIVTLFKAVTDDYGSNHNGFKYEPGSKPAAPDWDETPECGGGLHFCATPWQARDRYHSEATRYVGAPVKVADIVVIDESKVKVPRVHGPVFECDQDGVRL